MHTLQGKIAIITGGASGIGAGTCRRFIDHGATVVIADVDDARGTELSAELGPAASYTHVDVTREADIAAVVEDTAARFGRLDCMVNNAGRVGSWTYVEDTTVQEWDATFALLCRSVFLGIKHASRIMRDQESGSIVNTASVAGLRSGYGPHPYGAAKAAIIQLTRSSAMELAEYGVRVNAVTPGGVATRIVGHGANLESAELDESVDSVRQSLRNFQPIRRSGEPDDIASATAFLASAAADFITGQNIVVDGGLMLGRKWPKVYADEARAASTR